MPFSYSHPRPALTCDVVVFAMRADDLAVLLIKRDNEPFKGRWALPGGFVNENESLERAAARELNEETGLSGTRLEQLATFGDPGRDPRGHTVTVAYMTFLVTPGKITAGDDAREAEWHSFRTLTPKKLAFDHAKILSAAHTRLLQYLDNPLRERAFELWPSRFTLTELHHFYEVVTARKFPERAFKKRLLDNELVLPANPASSAKSTKQLYRWNRSK